MPNLVNISLLTKVMAIKLVDPGKLERLVAAQQYLQFHMSAIKVLQYFWQFSGICLERREKLPLKMGGISSEVHSG